MPRALIVSMLVWIAAVALAIPLSGTTSAQTVWSGFDFSFTKDDFADPTLPENQDRITNNVWLTRKTFEGIFNAKSETGYDVTNFSPQDTEWATYINNPTETIAAANYNALTFEPWIDAYGGQSGMTLPSRLTGGNAVVHLITDDVYLDLQFTFWRPSSSGGGFSYDRAMAPPGPETTGDYNHNGVVDAADYVVWRKTLNQSAVPAGSGADGDESGMIDDGDYTFWRMHFGEDVSPGSGSHAVPEPAAGVLLLCGVIALFGSPMRR